MSRILDEVLAANQRYVAQFGDKGALPLPPGHRFAVLTCMNARLDPAMLAGLAEGDAHVKSGRLIEVAAATEAGRASGAAAV